MSWYPKELVTCYRCGRRFSTPIEKLEHDRNEQCIPGLARLVSKFPRDQWVALGAISFPSSTARRLMRLGLVERRLVVGCSRMYDYRLTDKGRALKA